MERHRFWLSIAAHLPDGCGGRDGVVNRAHVASEYFLCDYIGMCIPRDLLSSNLIIISHCMGWGCSAGRGGGQLVHELHQDKELQLVTKLAGGEPDAPASCRRAGRPSMHRCCRSLDRGVPTQRRMAGTSLPQAG